MKQDNKMIIVPGDGYQNVKSKQADLNVRLGRSNGIKYLAYLTDIIVYFSRNRFNLCQVFISQKIYYVLTTK